MSKKNESKLLNMSKKLKIRITFNEEILGMSPPNKDVYRDYIASKSPNAATIEDEVASIGVDSVLENSTTVFPRTEDGQPMFWNYQVKGFFKDSCGMLNRVAMKDDDGKKVKGVNESSSIQAYKKVIDGLIFVMPRKIPIHFEGEMGLCERPLRAQSPQGERICLASSETIPAGAYIDIDILLLSKKLEDVLLEWLEYGELRGMGQWRNSGKGTFTWEYRD